MTQIKIKEINEASMRILHVCSILPLDGLAKENDFAIKTMEEINTINPNIEFFILKNIPYTNFFLSKVKYKWNTYYRYIKKRHITLNSYPINIYPWFMLPSSNFNLNKHLIKINRLYFLKKIVPLLPNNIGSYDLIISQNTNPDSIVANYISKKYKIPHIHILRGSEFKEVLQTPYYKRIIEDAALLITPSPTIYKYMVEKGWNLRLLPHGVDTEFYYSGIKDFSKPKLIVVSRLLKLKNIDIVIESLHRASLKGIDYELIIIGEGPERDSLMDIVNRYNLKDKIKFLGWRTKPEVIKYLKDANILMMPSYPETLGRVFLEAAASRCVCFGHYNTGIDGLFEDNINAIFCDKKNIDEKLHPLLNNISSTEFLRISTNGFTLANNFSWNSVASEYLDCFDKAIRTLKY